MTDIEKKSNLPDLNEKQLTFTIGILEGKSATDAYRDAYGCEGWKPSSIWSKASQLRSSEKVQQWLEAAAISRLKRSSLTAEEHMAELAGLRDEAKRKGQYASAIKAEMARGQVAGFYVSQYRDLTPTEKATDAELLDMVAKHLGITEEQVQQMINKNAVMH